MYGRQMVFKLTQTTSITECMASQKIHMTSCERVNIAFSRTHVVGFHYETYGEISPSRIESILVFAGIYNIV